MTGSRHETRSESLGPTQERILEQLAQRRTNAQIAASLGLSPETVKWHVSEILGKLGVDTREEAAATWRLAHGRHPWSWQRLAAGPLLRRAAPVVGGIAVISIAALVATLILTRGEPERPATYTPPNPTPSRTLSATATATVSSASLAASPTAVVPPGRSGVPVVDTFLTQFESSAELPIRPTRVGCVEAIVALGSPPECEPGEAAGTLIDTVPNLRCPEGDYQRIANVPVFLANAGELDAVVDVSQVPSLTVPPDEPVAYYLYFRSQLGPADLRIGINADGELVQIGSTCQLPAVAELESQFVAQGGRIIVPPSR